MNVIPIKPGSFKRNFIPLYMLHGIFLILFSMHLKIKMKTTSSTVYLNRSLALPEVSNNSNKMLIRQIKYQRLRRLESERLAPPICYLFVPTFSWRIGALLAAVGSLLRDFGRTPQEVGPFPGCTGALLDSPLMWFSLTHF